MEKDKAKVVIVIGHPRGESCKEVMDRLFISDPDDMDVIPFMLDGGFVLTACVKHDQVGPTEFIDSKKCWEWFGTSHELGQYLHPDSDPISEPVRIESQKTIYSVIAVVEGMDEFGLKMYVE